MVRKMAILIAVSGFIVFFMAVFTGISFWISLFLLSLAGSLLIIKHKTLRSFSFTSWVLTCVFLALAFPQFLQEWGGFKLSLLIVPLIQIIMFGMGTTISLKDFSRVIISPWPVLLGVVLQFGIMPVVGFMIAIIFGFEGELAAGIILIGSVSGGVASNLMVFISKGNVALSVTMTVVSTFLAPILTPILMMVYAGRFISIDAVSMMIGVINIIMIPVIAGLISHAILYSPKAWSRKIHHLILIIIVSLIVVLFSFIADKSIFGLFAPLRNGIILGGLLITIITLSKLVFTVMMGNQNLWINAALPVISMVGICAILMIIVAQTYDVLMEAGILLVVAAIIHNSTGYGLGYWGARSFGFILGRIGYLIGVRKTTASLIDEANCRTVAFEVGMQNGGMATGLAMDVLKSHIAALPPNIFGTWMNISGSLLANYWRDTNKS
jgi:bile acid:Na+ symporter, BASS family